MNNILLVRIKINGIIHSEFYLMSLPIKLSSMHVIVNLMDHTFVGEGIAK
jgi:hypothetical protein